MNGCLLSVALVISAAPSASEPSESVTARRTELVLYPAAMQVNDAFTEQRGIAIAAMYSVNETFSLTGKVLGNWHREPSALSNALSSDVSSQSISNRTLFLTAAVLAGFEVAPVNGHFELSDRDVRYQLRLAGAGGMAGSGHQLIPASETGPAVFADAGERGVMDAGIALRVVFGESFTFRAELHDLAYSSHVTAVNGCNLDDLTLVSAKVGSGQAASTANVTSSCKVGGGFRTLTEVSEAKALVRTTSSELLHDVSLFVGVGWTL